MGLFEQLGRLLDPGDGAVGLGHELTRVGDQAGQQRFARGFALALVDVRFAFDAGGVQVFEVVSRQEDRQHDLPLSGQNGLCVQDGLDGAALQEAALASLFEAAFEQQAVLFVEDKPSTKQLQRALGTERRSGKPTENGAPAQIECASFDDLFVGDLVIVCRIISSAICEDGTLGRPREAE